MVDRLGEGLPERLRKRLAEGLREGSGDCGRDCPRDYGLNTGQSEKKKAKQGGPLRQPGVRSWNRVDRELNRKKIAAVYRIGPCTSDEVEGERQIF